MPKEKKLPKLTKKQKMFADKFIETGKKGESALEAYDTDEMSVAAVIANENLNKPNVKEYIENHADRAAIRVVELSEQVVNLPVALGASKDILDRAGYKPVERSVSVVAQFNIENKEQVEGIALKVLEQMKNDETV